jgi:hypothetical protein
MAVEREDLRDWHRLFGLLLTDFFTSSPFRVDVERDLSVQQQLLDVVIVRRGRGRFAGRLPDGLDGLRPHNLVTFKSRHEALDGWAMKELVGADVAYRKLVSPTPSALLPQDQFGLYAVAARFPHNLSGQVPWQQVKAGVYDCRWGTDTIRVVVAGELPQETPRCTCSAPRRTWLTSAAAPTSAGRSRRVGYSASYLRNFEGRALPCRSRWRTSIASTSRNTSRNSRRRSARKFWSRCLQKNNATRWSTCHLNGLSMS